MDRNYCLIVFIVYMSYSDTQKVAKCCLYEKKIDVKKKGGATSKKKKGSCPHVPVGKRETTYIYKNIYDHTNTDI